MNYFLLVIRTFRFGGGGESFLFDGWSRGCHDVCDVCQQVLWHGTLSKLNIVRRHSPKYWSNEVIIAI